MAVEGGGGEVHGGLLLAAEGCVSGVLLGVEGAVVLARPAEAPTVFGGVDLGLFGAGARHLFRRFQ